LLAYRATNDATLLRRMLCSGMLFQAGSPECS
jgi:hypothetical protein